MIPHYGWQSVLVLGGVMPLLLAVALIFLLPESVRYLVVKQQAHCCYPAPYRAAAEGSGIYYAKQA